MNFYTVLFGVSRAFGVAAQLIWDRALGARTCDCVKSVVNRQLTHLHCSSREAQVVLYRGDREDVQGQELKRWVSSLDAVPIMHSLPLDVIHSEHSAIFVDI